MNPEISKKVADSFDAVVSYYIRSGNDPFAMVYVGKANGRFYRGVSICSIKDCFVKKTANDKAAGRLLKALKQNKQNDPITYERTRGNCPDSVRQFMQQEPDIKFKSDCDPVLTQFEKNLLNS